MEFQGGGAGYADFVGLDSCTSFPGVLSLMVKKQPKTSDNRISGTWRRYDDSNGVWRLVHPSGAGRVQCRCISIPVADDGTVRCLLHPWWG